MNHSSEPSHEPDSHLAERLDEYVQALHSGDFETCRELLTTHPELTPFAGSVELLAQMSPDVEFASALLSLLENEPEPKSDTSPGEPQQTMPVESDGAAKAQSPDLNPEPHDPEEPAGSAQVFGRYELLEELGRGGMGVVYRARQTDLNRIVAVKMILVNRLASRDDVRRFVQEAQAAGQLTHPNIVGIHEVGAVHGQHFFSMDCIDGPSLADVLARGPAANEPTGSSFSQQNSGSSILERSSIIESNMPSDSESAMPLTFEQAARMLRDVARAAHHLHTHSIVHRDFKPSNILLDENEQPFVTDFGLAKVFSTSSQETRSGAIVGTPSYMSPEQASGRLSDVGPCSDIYSIGAILYEALTGQPPHRESNAMETLVSVMEADPEIPRQINPDIPRELEAICLKCLDKDPARRYETAEELAADLDRFLTGEPVLAQTLGIVHRMRRWMRRQPALASRWSAIAIGTLILHASHRAGEVSAAVHDRILVLLGLWFLAAWIFQRLQRSEPIAPLARYLWLASDAVFLTRMLTLATPPVGPLVIVYPLLIASAGLFFHEGLVLFMTSVSLVSYATFLWHRPEEADPWHYPLIFSAVMTVIGVVISHHVHRLRTLSRHFS